MLQTMKTENSPAEAPTFDLNHDILLNDTTQLLGIEYLSLY